MLAPHALAEGLAAVPAAVASASRLEAAHLQKSYGARMVVKDVHLAVGAGEVVGLLGPNGAGKTTTFYMVVGLVRADRGEIRIDGQAVQKLPIHRRSRLGLSYLPQEASIFRKLTVEENIRAVLELQLGADGRPLKTAVINELLNKLLHDLSIDKLRDSPAPALSGGERRRVEIARALATQPRFILLDEPFAGVDPIAVISTPMPRFLRKPMMRWISSTAIGSTPAKGSSNRMKRGWVASARAISTRRRSPPDKDSAGASARCEIVRSSSSAERRFASTSASRSCSSRIARTFSATVSLRNIDASCGR